MTNFLLFFPIVFIATAVAAAILIGICSLGNRLEEEILFRKWNKKYRYGEKDISGRDKMVAETAKFVFEFFLVLVVIPLILYAIHACLT